MTSHYFGQKPTPPPLVTFRHKYLTPPPYICNYKFPSILCLPRQKFNLFYRFDLFYTRCGKTNILFVKSRKYCTHFQAKIKQQSVFYFVEDRNELITLCECWQWLIAVIVLCMDLPWWSLCNIEAKTNHTSFLQYSLSARAISQYRTENKYGVQMQHRTVNNSFWERFNDGFCIG